jgi:MFS family permease
MSTWNSIGGAICVAISAAGLIASWVAWRKRGAISGMRGIAWSLIPLAAYLTNSVLLIGRIASAIGRFASSFVFSPKSWAGVAVLAIALLLFIVSGGLPLLNWRKARERRKLAARAQGDAAVSPRAGSAPGTQPAAVEAPRRKAAAAPADPDDDMSEVEAILRARGIK